ncbi:MAG: dephospho-CoA kinase [Deltaproteobacteria bacterium]|nr:dephospho-CoA kinase [Deltaproteobacteria bacterium]
MKVFGLTGGIAAGKSEVASRLRAAGIPVIDADAVAREQARRGGAAYDGIVAEFGPSVLGPEGDIDRAALAAVAMPDPGRRARLEALTHGAVIGEVGRRLAVLAEMGHRVAVVEAPLLVETGLHEGLDGLVVVTAGANVRLGRAVARGGVTEADAAARIAAQASDERRLAAATEVIVNDGTIEDLARRAIALAVRLGAKGSQWPKS